MHQDGRSAHAGTMRELLTVAVPLVLSSGSLSLMHVIDRILLTQYSIDALAAALPAGILHWTVMSLAIGTGSYLNAFVAQYDGARRPDRLAASVWQGVYLAVGAGLLFMLFAPLSDSIFALIGHAPHVRELETDYFAALCLGSPPIVLAAVLACYFSGRGKSLPVMFVNITSVTVNAVLAYLLIFGIGPLPELGIQGAAVATITANCVAVAIYAILIARESRASNNHLWNYRGFDRELFGRLLRYGLPTGFQFLIDVGAFSLFVLMVGTLGKTELSATNLAFNLNSLAFVPMLGLGIAVSTLVGRRIGEGRPELAVRTTWLAFALTAAFMGVWTVLYIFAPDVMLIPYAANSTPEEFAPLRDLTVLLLRFAAVFACFDGMVIIFGAAIRGAGDTRFSLIFTCLSGWLIMVAPTAYIKAFHGGNLMGSWAACTLYVVVLGIGFLLRFQYGPWKSMRVIEPLSDDSGDDESPPVAPRRETTQTVETAHT